jgi:hypothetical protein
MPVEMLPAHLPPSKLMFCPPGFTDVVGFTCEVLPGTWQPPTGPIPHEFTHYLLTAIENPQHQVKQTATIKVQIASPWNVSLQFLRLQGLARVFLFV